MLCQERARLLIDYRNAVHGYSERVHNLVEAIGLGINAPEEPLRRKIREAWDAAENARLALARHEANHLCDRPDFVGSSAPV